MNRLNKVLVAGLFVTAVGAAHAQESARVETLGWLAGCWSGTIDGLEMEELWLAPRGDVMLGLHRDTKKGRPAGFEFLRIAQTSEGVAYFASPQGRTPTPFPLKEVTASRAVFENLQHDFPKRIIYERRGNEQLCARIEGAGGEKEGSQEWCWKRQVRSDLAGESCHPE